MQWEDSARLHAEPAPGIEPSLRRSRRGALIPALVCAGLCVILMRTGFLSFLFLVPLGLCAVVYGPTAAWLGLAAAVLGNSVWALGLSLHYGMGLGNTGVDILYFSALVVGFTWIMAGRLTPTTPPIRTLYRFIAAAIVGALALMATIFSLGSDEGFVALLRSQIELISSSYIASSGADAAGQAYMERLLTADRIIETFSLIIVRGGALVSAFFLFFFSRQAAFILAWLFRVQRGNGLECLIGFYVPRRAIWVLSLCLPVIVFSWGKASLQLIEIVAWNLLVMCAIMFLAQGGGIVLFNLIHRFRSMIMRLICTLLMVFVALSPGLNVVAMGALALLGIAETWLPLRRKGVESRE